MENIKSTLANEIRRVLSDTLARGGYKLVDEDGEDVLRVQAAIVNLYITAPSAAAPGRSRNFVANTGQMTLVAELRDSVTGQLLARAVDTVRGRQTGGFQLGASVTNMAAPAAHCRNGRTCCSPALTTRRDARQPHSPRRRAGNLSETGPAGVVAVRGRLITYRGEAYP